MNFRCVGSLSWDRPLLFNVHFAEFHDNAPSFIYSPSLQSYGSKGDCLLDSGEFSGMGCPSIDGARSSHSNDSNIGKQHDPALREPGGEKHYRVQAGKRHEIYCVETG